MERKHFLSPSTKEKKRFSFRQKRLQADCKRQQEKKILSDSPSPRRINFVHTGDKSRKILINGWHATQKKTWKKNLMKKQQAEGFGTPPTEKAPEPPRRVAMISSRGSFNKDQSPPISS
ncbi:hypothetical protein RUM44_011961 [Polyplax serrata]|uniref:Uncharacterized protein n=1 Tax=Polyplax serrata TaxID=468196 RepID=A0ABR1BA03_POLSC